MADVSDRLVSCHRRRETETREKKKKEIYQKFNRAAILFMRVYVSDESEESTYLHILKNSGPLRDSREGK